MKKLTGYMAGVNLGGWISQYRDLDHEHFKSFITEKDIQTIASWGMDHVRVPVDYPVLEDNAKPGVFLESGFAYLDNAIAWTKKYGINLVIDVHRAPGFSFGSPGNTLFTDTAMQGRFVALWKAIARRYRGEGANVLYELLNEVVDPDSSRWNSMAEKLISGIREEDSEHSIVVGGIHYNSVKALAALPIFKDDKIVYTFHMYEPMALTHQKARWVKAAMNFNRDMTYPSEDIKSYLEYLEVLRDVQQGQSEMDKEFLHRVLLKDYEGLTRMDKKFIYQFLKPAFDFIEKHDKPMYCGEYGVIDHTGMASREAWSADLSDVLLEYGIGRAVWSYKQMSFTLIDKEGKPVSEKLVKAVSKI